MMMCEECKHLSKCIEIVVQADVIYRALEEYEMFCPMEYPELMGLFEKGKE